MSSLHSKGLAWSGKIPRYVPIFGRWSHISLLSVQNLEAAYNAVVRTIQDPELPVRVSAVLALMHMIDHEEGPLPE